MKNKIKEFLKKFDCFGVNINFHYKSQDKYKSIFGGIIFINFIIFILVYISLYIKKFIMRKNMSIIYYNNNINNTDIINFYNYSIDFAFGIECNDYENFETLQDIKKNFFYSIAFVKAIRINNTNLTKEKENINYHACEYKDFNNEFNYSFDILKLNNLYCPEKLNFSIQGISTNEIYSHYEISISGKNMNSERYNYYYNLLINQECYFSLYYTDFSIDLHNLKNPHYKHIEKKLIQLSPIEYRKKELFFLIYKFFSYDSLIFENSKKYLLIKTSKEIDYNCFKGYERTNKTISNYNKFGKFFLKTDTQETIIERRYMKLNEFLSEISTLFSVILFLNIVIITIVNTTLAYNEIAKKIFLFKFEDLSFKTRESIMILPKFSILRENKNSKNNKKEFFEGFNQNLKKVYKNHNILNVNKTNINISTSLIKDKSEEDFNINKNNNLNKINSYKSIEVLKINNSYLKIKKNLKSMRKMSLDNQEYIIFFICPCCVCKKLKIKKNLTKNGKEQIYKMLDVLAFLNKMQQIEIMQNILFEDYQKKIMNYISKPLISLSNKNQNLKEINNVFEEKQKELNDYINSCQILLNKEIKTKNDLKILNLVNEMNMK